MHFKKHLETNISRTCNYNEVENVENVRNTRYIVILRRGVAATSLNSTDWHSNPPTGSLELNRHPSVNVHQSAGQLLFDKEPKVVFHNVECCGNHQQWDKSDRKIWKYKYGILVGTEYISHDLYSTLRITQINRSISFNEDYYSLCQCSMNI